MGYCGVRSGWGGVVRGRVLWGEVGVGWGTVG